MVASQNLAALLAQILQLLLSAALTPTTSRWVKAKIERKKNGIFPLTSRINHSCIPNAYFAWNPDLGPSGDKGRLTIYAIVLIPKGAEILINYRTGDFSKTRLQRHTELSYYRFRCICPACEPNTESGRASEQRRGQMQTLQDNIEQNGDPILPALRSRLLADIKALGLLLQQERLFYPQLADLYHQEVLWYSREMKHVANWAESAEYKAGLLGEALEVARKKLDLDVVCNGHDSPVVKKTLKFIYDLKRE